MKTLKNGDQINVGGKIYQVVDGELFEVQLKPVKVDEYTENEKATNPDAG